MTTQTQSSDLGAYAQGLARAARKAGRELADVSGAAKDALLRDVADGLTAAADALMRANALDLAAGRQAGLAESVLERLSLNEKRIAGIAEGVRQVAALPDPVGEILG